MKRRSESRICGRAFRVVLPAAVAVLAALVCGPAMGQGEARSMPADPPPARTGPRADQRPATATSAQAAHGADTRPLPGRKTPDEGGYENRPLSPGKGRAGGGWVQTLLALALVVGLIFAVRLVLRRLTPAARMRSAPGVIEVLAQANLSARHQVHLVRLGRRLVLVGVAGDTLNCLCEITAADEVSHVLARIEAAGEAKGTAAKTAPDAAEKTPHRPSGPQEAQ